MGKDNIAQKRNRLIVLQIVSLFVFCGNLLSFSIVFRNIGDESFAWGLWSVSNYITAGITGIIFEVFKNNYVVKGKKIVIFYVLLIFELILGFYLSTTKNQISSFVIGLIVFVLFFLLLLLVTAICLKTKIYKESLLSKVNRVELKQIVNDIGKYFFDKQLTKDEKKALKNNVAAAISIVVYLMIFFVMLVANFTCDNVSATSIIIVSILGLTALIFNLLKLSYCEWISVKWKVFETVDLVVVLVLYVIFEWVIMPIGLNFILIVATIFALYPILLTQKKMAEIFAQHYNDNINVQE